MTKTLLVAATPLEASWLQAQIQQTQRTDLQVLITGIGMVNAAWKLGQALVQQTPARVIQFGVAGAYSPALDLLEVVEVSEETFGDLGAETDHGFFDLEAIGFPSIESPLCYNTFIQPAPMHLRKLVTGLTCNTIHGEQQRIEIQKQRWNKEIETMEGAVVFQLCLAHQIPFAEFRCISNFVEPRNPSRWKLKEAAQRMQEFLWDNREELW